MPKLYVAKFKDLAINQRFDWIGGDHPSFFRPCRKSGRSTYVDDLLNEYNVGSISATVYHVEPMTGLNDGPMLPSYRRNV